MRRTANAAWSMAAVALVALAMVPGCGGNKGEPSATPKMAPSHLESTPEQDRDGDALPGPSGAGPTFARPPSPPSATAPAPMDREASRVQARDAFARAELELQASASDCAAACRALGSLERAATRLCELAESPDDRRRCDDAKQKLGAARDRVRQTCNACPGGPTLERSAPTP